MAEKRYFWLKLKSDFFAQKEIKKLRRIAGGDTYTIIYLKMQLKSLENNGKLYYEGFEDTFASELALDLDEDQENVQVTLIYLEKHNLVEKTVVDNIDEYLIPAVGSNLGTETATAVRVRKHREKHKMLQSNNDVTPLKHFDNGEIEIEKEQELELEQEIEKDIIIATPDPKYIEAEEIANYLLNKILVFNPSFKGNSAKWHLEIEKAIRLDGRTKEQLINCINWIHTSSKGSFWIPNILSGAKLRKQFDTMNIQAINDKQFNDEAFIKELCKDQV